MKLRGTVIQEKKDNSYSKFLLDTHSEKNSKKNHYALKRYILNPPDKTAASLNKAAVKEMRAGNFIEAKIILNTAAGYYPEDPQIKNNTAVLYEIMGNETMAFQNYVNALQLMPGSKPILDNFILFKYKPSNIRLSIP